MKSEQELLPETWIIRLNRFQDARGSFVKTYARTALQSLNIEFDVLEEFYSLSNKDVVRGMHFQAPPYDHSKIVFCPVGEVLDVLLDLRAGPGYGKTASVLIGESQPSLLLIPKGIAHGFHSLRDGSLMIYKTDGEYARSHDLGIRWNSIDFDWGISKPIISERDSKHIHFSSFNTPFSLRK